MSEHYVGKGFRWFLLYALALFLALATLVAKHAMAATTSESTVTVQLKRGTTLVTLVPAPTTLTECEQRRDGLISIDAQTKFSGTGTYSCIETRRMVVTFTPNPQPVPVDCVVSDWGAWVLGTPTACVDGQQTRQDSRTRTIVTQPANGGAACPSLSESAVVALTCTVTPPPPVPSALANLTGTITANAADQTRSDVKLTWSAVPGAAEYEVWRAIGTSCANWAFIPGADVVGTTYTNANLPPGFTYCYRTRAWKPALWPFSQIITLTTPTTPSPPPPPPPPPPTGEGKANISWTAPTQNSDGSTLSNLAGYRIEYGPVGIAGPLLNQAIDVRNPGLQSYVVDGLAAGDWAFAVSAYSTTGAYSSRSSIATKKVL